MGISKIPDGGGGTGTVTSVGLTVPARQTVTGSPVTTTGTLAVTDNVQVANTVFSGPTTGADAAPTFRALVAADVPAGFIKGTAADAAGVLYQNGTANTATTNAALTYSTSTGLTNTAPYVSTRGTLSGASSPSFSSTTTWNNAATTFVHNFVNVTDTTSATASLLSDLQVGGVSKFNIRKDGRIVTTGQILGTHFSATNPSGYIGWGDSGRSLFLSPADGVLELTNNGQNDFNRLQFGGTTSSFPSLKRSTTSIQVRLADDSAFAPISASTVTLATIYTVATLPTGVEGMRAAVSDATAPVFLTTLTGGGAVHCPAYYNGTAWVAA